jgi:hypothetical protein
MANPEHGGYNPDENREPSFSEKVKEHLSRIRDRLSGKKGARIEAYNASANAWGTLNILMAVLTKRVLLVQNG